MPAKNYKIHTSIKIFVNRQEVPCFIRKECGCKLYYWSFIQFHSFIRGNHNKTNGSFNFRYEIFKILVIQINSHCEDLRFIG